ncbi:hypothetical protein KEM55_006703, partial [Ascosphaera atra]
MHRHNENNDTEFTMPSYGDKRQGGDSRGERGDSYAGDSYGGTQREEEAPVVSHGRGGTGNIARDSTQYTDGGIVRAGPEGDQGDGAWSAGRGGAGNIGAQQVPHSRQPNDTDVVPESAMKGGADESHHVGTQRGGAGNVHHHNQHHDSRPEPKGFGIGQNAEG